MKKLFCILALLVFCSVTHAALVNNPESFEDEYFPLPGDPFYPGWESWCSGSGSGGWSSSNCGAFITGGGTDGDNSLATWVGEGGFWGYSLAFNGGNPIVPGEIYEYFFDYMYISGAGGVFKLEFWDAENNPLDVVAWDPFPVAIPDVWHHFSHTFRAPANAVSATIVVGTTGVNSTMRYDMIGLLPADCPYELEGDLDNDCRVNLVDFVLLASNWLLDCIDTPTDPACVTP